MPNTNCWEFLKCGREPGGKNIDELGVCPASTYEKMHGTNYGKNAGRICWLVAGTFCDGKVQGNLACKINSCIECPFFNQIHEELNWKKKIFQIYFFKINGNKIYECVFTASKIALQLVETGLKTVLAFTQAPHGTEIEIIEQKGLSILLDKGKYLSVALFIEPNLNIEILRYKLKQCIEEIEGSLEEYFKIFESSKIPSEKIEVIVKKFFEN